MQSTTSTTTQDQTHQREVAKDLDISKSKKFHLTASKEDRKKLKSIEELFLNTLGLSKRPRISTQYAVPEYMLDLYNIHSQHSNRRHRYMQVKGNGAIAANTVRSFLHAGKKVGMFVLLCSGEIKTSGISASAGNEPYRDK